MSDLKIVRLDPAQSRKADVVARLNELLGMAERGELIDLTYSAALADGSVITGFTETEDAHRRLSGVSRLLHRLHKSMDGDD